MTLSTRLVCIATAGLSIVCCSARAQSYDRCIAAAGGIDTRMKLCAVHELDNRNALLNSTYKALAAKLNPTRQSSLRSAERAWLAFRDAECAFRSSAETGGTDAAFLDQSCLLDLTTKRIEDLEKAAKVANF